MYGMLQVQNNLEEKEYLSDCEMDMAQESSAPAKKSALASKGKRHLSKLDDNMSSAVHNFANYNRKKKK